MKRKHAIAVKIIVISSFLTMTGCGNVDAKRTPEEWLSLSYSGLAATDQYAFTGSMSIKTAAGLEFKPEIFEGKVVDHKQLTLQSNSEDPLHWNPVQVLGALNNNNEEIRIAASDTKESETVTLLIKEHSDTSKKRWEQRLRNELDELVAAAPAEGSPGRQEWMAELAHSREQLETMLKSMEAATEYELTIDRDRLLPLKMEEKTTFSYTYGKQPVSESRYTTVRFQAFNGTATNAVQ
ncbi:hypothetical protein BK133_05710 [Paenibacillus sp. FSL H8-0548]|uniref:hypothetical protein n=1 Tax=Paenibacillus sp. FSL H8-0548 TaxID=1920422 RepID=UPI00096F3519|nr:hypothetical protein [Paenibacillus sp. FSL H8-0548]OMF37546.1 hypothetical protein BK133_05710 [Paenibacillus sp. FSL H8-0548]